MNKKFYGVDHMVHLRRSVVLQLAWIDGDGSPDAFEGAVCRAVAQGVGDAVKAYADGEDLYLRWTSSPTSPPMGGRSRVVSIIDEHTRQCLGGLARSVTGEHLIAVIRPAGLPVGHLSGACSAMADRADR